MRLLTLLLVVCPFLAAAALEAAIVEVPVAKDATLFQNDTGAIANGAGQHLFVGNTREDNTRRGLIAFDLTGIPAGSTINGAVLSLHMSRTVSGDVPIGLHRVTRDWGEGSSDANGVEGMGTSAQPGDATWIHTFFDNEMWETAGGDFVETASAVQAVGSVGRYEWPSTPQVIADVQQWLSDGSSNFGWMLRGAEDRSQSVKRFDTHEIAQAAQRPRLTIDFTVGIDALSAAVRTGSTDPVFDLNEDGQISQEDRRVWIEELNNTYFGDSNLDGEFNSSDLVTVFQAGQFEDTVSNNSLWSTGDWNGDGEFDSSDFVRAFQAGGFEQGPRAALAAVPEPGASLMMISGLFLLLGRRPSRAKR